MNSKIYKSILILLIVISLYNLLYITSVLLPDSAVSYQWLSNLDQISALKVPSMFLAPQYYINNPHTVILNFFIDGDGVVSSFPFILILVGAISDLITNKKSKLASLGLLYLLITVIWGFIRIILCDFPIPEYSVYYFLLPVCYLSGLLFLIIKRNNAISEQYTIEKSSNTRLICAYMIDSVIGASLSYLFSIFIFNELISTQVYIPFFLFHFLIFKLSMFLYSFLFETVLSVTIGKYILKITTKTKEGNSLSIAGKLQYSIFQLIPFWYLFISVIESRTNTSTYRYQLTILNRIVWIGSSFLIIAIISVYNITKIENKFTHNINNLIEIFSRSMLTAYDISSKPLPNQEFQFYLGGYNQLIKAESLNDNISNISFEQRKQIRVNYSIKSINRVQSILLKLETKNGLTEVLQVTRYKNRQIKVTKFND